MAQSGQWRITRIFEETVRGDERFVFNEGGTRSGKTIAILQVLHWTMEMNPNQNLIISVVSETMPHLRRGAMLDYFDRILKPAGLYDPANHNKTDNSYTVNGNRIEFFSADSSDKVHGPGRDILYFNELQNTNFDTFFHLVQRTRLKIYADWNPTHEFFVHSKFLNNPDYDGRIKYIHSTYKDNPYLPQDIVRDILNRAKYDENYRLVYVEGKIGVKEGVIFDFEQVDEMPEGEYVYGMDFGYTNDPTAVIRVLITGEAIYMDEVVYKHGLTNAEISGSMLDKIKDYEEIFADSAEPKSIDDIFSMGWNIKPAIKGEINWGIDVMKRYKLLVTKRSLNLIKEFRNYTWDVNKNGEPTGKPISSFNHAIDAVRYAVTNKLQTMTDYKILHDTNTDNRL